MLSDCCAKVVSNPEYHQRVRGIYTNGKTLPYAGSLVEIPILLRFGLSDGELNSRYITIVTQS